MLLFVVSDTSLSTLTRQERAVESVCDSCNLNLKFLIQRRADSLASLPYWHLDIHAINMLTL